MRIVIANDGMSDAGGVHAYLEAVIGVLQGRGHEVALVYCSDAGASRLGGSLPRLATFRAEGGVPAALETWKPDVCFSHNMQDLPVDRGLAGLAPLVKFMHGYFGTCVGGLKTHAFPSPVACGRAYGPACLALYLPRRCGQVSPAALVRQWRWAEAQRGLFDHYAAVVVASEHMRDEYVQSGLASARVHVNHLFPTGPVDRMVAPAPREPHVVFLGRMTALKGGDLLVRAVGEASARFDHPIALTMVGDGPQRGAWESLATRLRVRATFTGWIAGDERWRFVRRASAVALPSRWPEPFGLVGLEAGGLGVPAIAVNSGGVGSWLRHGLNGVLVPAPATPSTFAAALVALLGDGARLDALKAGAHRVAQQMSVDAHVDRLERLFRSVRSAACRS